MVSTHTSPYLLTQLDAISSQIGHTPLYPIEGLIANSKVKLFAKLEWQQLGQSVKARAAFRIIKSALLSGQLGEGKRLLDATSGNTGIAYAAICARLGIPLTLCVPGNASPERKLILQALGAEIVYTSAMEATEGAQLHAKELLANDPHLYFYADQYSNPENWQAHYHSTASEVYHQSQGGISHFVAGLGTTGTFTGTIRKLKEINPDIRGIALQPDSALHALEGWKHLETAGVPAIYQPGLPDEIRTVTTEDAYAWLKRFARHTGMLISPSAAANLAGSISLAQELEDGVIVTSFADDAAKYYDTLKTIF